MKDSHAAVIVGGGPTGLMLAGELALARVDVAIVERRENQELVGRRAGGLHARTIEVLDQRGVADRFLARGQVMQVAAFAGPLDISDCPTRHNYGLALRQNHIERILADWVDELAVPIYRGREVTTIVQDDTGVDAAMSDGRSLRARFLVGCDGGRSVIRKHAGIDFVGWEPSTSYLIAEVEPRKRYGAMMSGLDIHYDLGAGHPLLGRRMPDLDLVTDAGPRRVFTLLHDARPVLIQLAGAFDIAPWADRVRQIDARYDGAWELPVLGAVAAPAAVLIRPDGHVAWVGEGTDHGLRDALATWFGSPVRPAMS